MIWAILSYIPWRTCWLKHGTCLYLFRLQRAMIGEPLLDFYKGWVFLNFLIIFARTCILKTRQQSLSNGGGKCRVYILISDLDSVRDWLFISLFSSLLCINYQFSELIYHYYLLKDGVTPHFKPYFLYLQLNLLPSPILDISNR